MPEAKPIAGANVVLWGGYGLGNVGDELTLAVAISRFRASNVQNLAVISPTPGYTRALFPDVRVIPYRPVWRSGKGGPAARWFFRSVLCRRPIGEGYLPAVGRAASTTRTWAESIIDADLLYLVGGGYLTDLFDLPRFLCPIEVALKHRVPVRTAPLGIGPFRTKAAERAFVSAFRHVQLSVRDPRSQHYCESLGLAVNLKRDDGFGVDDVVAKPSAFPKQSHACTLGVNFFRQHGSRSPDKLTEWWKRFLLTARDDGIELEGFCFHLAVNTDYDSMCEIFHEVGLPVPAVVAPSLDFRAACQRLLKYRAVISSRFHAAVVCSAWNIPCLAVSAGGYYDAKMAAACAGASASTHINAGKSSPAEAYALIRTVSMGSTMPAL